MAFKLKKSDAASLHALVEAYESAREDLAQELENIASQWEADFSDKSEKWQEGDNGQLAQERIDLVRGWCDGFPDVCEINPDDLL